MAILCPGDVIELEHLPDFLRQRETDGAPFRLDLGSRESVSLPELVLDFERRVIDWAMRRAQGNQSRAARLLGIPRTTLQSKLES